MKEILNDTVKGLESLGPIVALTDMKEEKKPWTYYIELKGIAKRGKTYQVIIKEL